MLRLTPTTVPLTRGEILQYEMRAEKRRQMRELLKQEGKKYLTHEDSSPDLYVDPLRPRIQRGPGRRAKYYSNTPSSASSSFNTIVEDDDATLEPRSSTNYAKPGSSVRRDSVLSSESTGPTSRTEESPKNRGRCAVNDSWINEALSSLRVSDEEGSQEQTQSDPYRRSHCRSASDPTCLAMTSVRKPRSALHSFTQRRRTVSSSSASDQEGALADTKEDGSSEGTNDGLSKVGHFESRMQQASRSSSFHGHVSTIRSDAICSSANDREESFEHGALSALENVASNASSPLDQLVEDVTALRRAPWVVSLASRPRLHSCRLVRLPNFSDEDGLASTPTPQDFMVAADLPDDHARDEPVSPESGPHHRHRRQGSSTYPTASWTTPSLTGPAQDVTTHTRSQASFHRSSAIRRRPVPGADQENVDELVPYLTERRAWLARQNEPYRGRLDRTPSPGGDLERRLS